MKKETTCQHCKTKFKGYSIFYPRQWKKGTIIQILYCDICKGLTKTVHVGNGKIKTSRATTDDAFNFIKQGRI